MHSNSQIKEMKDAILAIGSAYDWIHAEMNDLIKQAFEMLESGKAKSVKHAAFKVIDQYF